MTLTETLSIEDYDDEGFIPLQAFKDSINSLELDQITAQMLDYMTFYVFTKSESVNKMNYKAIFDLLEEKALTSAAGDSRKRPESSSPEKLKARNNKFQGASEAEKKHQEKEDEYEDDNYEEEFEKLLDKDDEDDEDGGKNSTVKINDDAEP